MRKDQEDRVIQHPWSQLLPPQNRMLDNQTQMTAKLVILASISKKTLRFQANPVAVRSNSIKTGLV